MLLVVFHHHHLLLLHRRQVVLVVLVLSLVEVYLQVKQLLSFYLLVDLQQESVAVVDAAHLVYTVHRF